MGFIGSNLAHRLVGLGAEVTVVDHLHPNYGGNWANLAGVEDRVRVCLGDACEEAWMHSVVAGQDFVFNLAGQTSHLDSLHDPGRDLRMNCGAPLAVLEAVRKEAPGAKVVFASTRQIYGRPRYLPVDEEHPLSPVDVNGIHKLAGEHYHLLYHQIYGVRACALRLTNTYGPRMRVKDARQTFLGVWIRAALEGKPVEVWGGRQLRDFTFGEDCVEALLSAGGNGRAEGRIYNLGGLEVVSLADLAQMLAEVVGGARVECREFPPERQRIDIGDYCADWSRVREELGWEPRVALRAGLEATVGYYRERLGEYV
jgi:UDP-glucose 4-epimerase